MGSELLEHPEVMKAATVVCLRPRRVKIPNVNKNPVSPPNTISSDHLFPRNNLPNYDQLPAKTDSGWEVLLGQGEVKNWLRSTKTNCVIMRYPGEWKFPGGAADDTDVDLKETARRELEEEFLGIDTNNKATLRFLSKKFTKSIQGRRYFMYNYAAYQHQNESWMTKGLDKLINDNLKRRKENFEKLLQNGTYWQLKKEEKLRISPEIYRVSWIELDTAIKMMSGSLLNDRLECVDEWQKEQFEKFKIKKRDPMYQSMRVLVQLRNMLLESAATDTVSRI